MGSKLVGNSEDYRISPGQDDKAFVDRTSADKVACWAILLSKLSKTLLQTLELVRISVLKQISDTQLVAPYLINPT